MCSHAHPSCPAACQAQSQVRHYLCSCLWSSLPARAVRKMLSVACVFAVGPPCVQGFLGSQVCLGLNTPEELLSQNGRELVDKAPGSSAPLRTHLHGLWWGWAPGAHGCHLLTHTLLPCPAHSFLRHPCSLCAGGPPRALQRCEDGLGGSQLLLSQALPSVAGTASPRLRLPLRVAHRSRWGGVGRAKPACLPSAWEDSAGPPEAGAPCGTGRGLHCPCIAGRILSPRDSVWFFPYGVSAESAPPVPAAPPPPPELGLRLTAPKDKILPFV